MSLLHLQLMMTDRQQTTVKAMAEFNALLYGPYFLKSLLAIKASRLDLQLWRDLLAYAAVYQIQNPAGWNSKLQRLPRKVSADTCGI